MSNQPVFVSPEGLEKIRQELEELDGPRRKELIDRIEKAKELGDLRENADYQDAKEELAWITSRILDLRDRLARAEVVTKSFNTEVVSIGCKVKVQYGDKERIITIVGATEANPIQGLISNESPLGRELIGKKIGEAAKVEAPIGEISYVIKEIS